MAPIIECSKKEKVKSTGVVLKQCEMRNAIARTDIILARSRIKLWLREDHMSALEMSLGEFMGREKADGVAIFDELLEDSLLICAEAVLSTQGKRYQV